MKTGESNGSSTTRGYKVEARTDIPKQVGSQIFTEQWRPISFSHGGPPGVPNDTELDRHGLLKWEAAQALRWWFLAEARKIYSSFDTRIVEYELAATYNIQRKDITEELKSSASWGPK